MKHKKILARVSAWLLTAALLAVGVPATTVSSEADPALADSLLIHYDFEGDTPEEQLADKAGDVKSDLQAISGLTYAYAVPEAETETGDGTTAEKEVTGIASVDYIADTAGLFEVKDGVITATTATDRFCLMAEQTSDVDATYGHGDASLNATYYLRVKLPETGPVPFLYNRNMNTINRSMHLCTEARGVITVATNDDWKIQPAYIPNQWMEMAVVRDADASTQSLYFRQNAAWVKVSSINSVNVKDMVSPFILFGELNAEGSQNDTWAKVPTGLAYDDVRFYNKALTVEELETVHKEVSPLAENISAGSTLGELNTSILNDNLLIHYDFEGTTWQEQLSDKAGDVETDLTAVNKAFTVASDGTVPAESQMDETAAQEIFQIDGGVATSLKSGADLAKGAAALVSGITADTKAIQNAESGATWFMRVQLPAAEVCVPLNFRNTNRDTDTSNERAFHMKYDGGEMILYYATGPKAEGQRYQQQNVPMASAAGNWVDMAWVRSAFDGSHCYYTFLYKVAGQSEWTVAVKDMPTFIPTSEATTLSLFANAANESKDIADLSKFSIDDVRVYNKALTVGELNILTGTPVNMLGAQRSENTFDNGTTYRVRLVAEIAGDDWTRAGFLVSLNGTERQLPVYWAYDSLISQPNGGLTVTVEASEGCHLIAVVIGGIPIAERSDMTLTVTPYAKKDGDDALTQGKSVTVTLQDSQIASITWVE